MVFGSENEDRRSVLACGVAMLNAPLTASEWAFSLSRYYRRHCETIGDLVALNLSGNSANKAGLRRGLYSPNARCFRVNKLLLNSRVRNGGVTESGYFGLPEIDRDNRGHYSRTRRTTPPPARPRRAKTIAGQITSRAVRLAEIRRPSTLGSGNRLLPRDPQIQPGDARTLHLTYSLRRVVVTPYGCQLAIRGSGFRLSAEASLPAGGSVVPSRTNAFRSSRRNQVIHTAVVPHPMRVTAPDRNSGLSPIALT